MNEVLLEVKNLVKHFPVKAGIFQRTVAVVKAVDGVSFQIKKGETFGLVGESGCGKTTTGRCVLMLETPTSGEIVFKGVDITKLSQKQLRKLRPKMQIVFQDPFSSLNPRLPIKEIIGEAIAYHGIAKGREVERRVQELLEMVGLSVEHMNRYPHEFSGGQRQRICIARALATEPDLIVCDEAVSALDVSIQSQILKLLENLQAKLGVAYLFISHALNVVKYISHRIGVMYLGKLVEVAESEELYLNPLHPYTKALISAVPVPDPKLKRKKIILKGDVPSPLNPPRGCRFVTRCPQAMQVCGEIEPQLIEVAPNHFVACHLYSWA
ncbi:MAG: ABC transporter ATP-binding protein [Pseudothermotoga sp.]|uniref:Peptide ABC transporter substrate-binding protein n=2 Tax=Pseudothermotoga hypogea TaxID=57487 RepID=A0A0X1KQZ1_9THEM|nr:MULTISPECIES: ABC transporter ATP-binding protein [Pseudothermotoga]AJC73673.1 peptide ABC transporter substrate-binding protein [Pseudothermotoga hypogea DSM 11164 = NBRC 106472]MBC7116538.1 ABC transporter ATP-binding protein [Pseudothermotoga sp.]MBC7121795.1 ABC transporter ATP-binding protein [Pseudothermotoga sp.]MDI6862822.1 ABC transporter ATP-binding protein [Pseudothermotoga sp.]